MNATKAIAAAGLGLAVLLAGAVLGRRAPAERRPEPRAAARTVDLEAADEPPPLIKPTPAERHEASRATPAVERRTLAALRTQRRADQEFWDELGGLVEVRSSVAPASHREHVTSITTGYLGLENARAAAFEQTAAQSVEQIGRAWKARDEALLALPAWLGSEERSRKEREIQERYEDAKRQEVERVEALLDGTPRHLRFRSRLGEWIDAVR